MRLPPWIRIGWWAILFALSSTMLWQRFPEILHGSPFSFDVFLLLIWTGLALAPIFPDVNVFGLHLKQEAESGSLTKEQLQRVADRPKGDRTKTEYKILNTLWTYQVNHFPTFNGVWTFRVQANAPSFFEYNEARWRLIQEGLVSETNEGQLFLTPKGIRYCREHHRRFPSDHWFPEQDIDPTKLAQALTASLPDEPEAAHMTSR